MQVAAVVLLTLLLLQQGLVARVEAVREMFVLETEQQEPQILAAAVALEVLLLQQAAQVAPAS